MGLSQEIHVVVSDPRLCIALKDSSSEVGESLHLNLSLSLPGLWLGGTAFSEKVKKKWSEVAQSCPTLCNPRDCRLPGSPSMGFSRQEYWSWLPFPSPGDLPNPGIEPRSPTLQADSLLSEPRGKLWENPDLFLWLMFILFVFPGDPIPHNPWVAHQKQMQSALKEHHHTVPHQIPRGKSAPEGDCVL